MHFLLFLKKSFKIFSKIPKWIMVFVKTRESLMQVFEMILKMDQNNAFLYFFKEIFENFLKNVHAIGLLVQSAKV